MDTFKQSFSICQLFFKTLFAQVSKSLRNRLRVWGILMEGNLLKTMPAGLISTILHLNGQVIKEN